MTLIQEKEFKHYEHSLRSIIIQIEQNKLLTEKQKQETIKILREENGHKHTNPQALQRGQDL